MCVTRIFFQPFLWLFLFQSFYFCFAQLLYSCASLLNPLMNGRHRNSYNRGIEWGRKKNKKQIIMINEWNNDIFATSTTLWVRSTVPAYHTVCDGRVQTHLWILKYLIPAAEWLNEQQYWFRKKVILVIIESGWSFFPIRMRHTCIFEPNNYTIDNRNLSVCMCAYEVVEQHRVYGSNSKLVRFDVLA